MPPIPSNNTAVFYVDYTANGRDHTIQFRYPQSGVLDPPSAQFVGDVEAFLNGMRPFMPTDWTILGTRQRGAGETITIPSSIVTLAGPGLQPAAQADAPGFFSFVGRDATGVRVRLTLLGAGQTPVDAAAYDNDYRITAGESADIDAVVSILQSAAFLTVSGGVPLWRPYANVGYNAYWQREARG